MAALPLTLDTLKSPSNESALSSKSPLMSPQCLKADALSSSNDMETAAERPSNLTLDSAQQQKQRQQPQEHNLNVTPLSAATALCDNISPSLSGAGSVSPSFLPEMPQWKRDLIQRRKQNVQRTISASSSTSSSATGLSSSQTTAFTGGGLKASISSSSMRSIVGSNTNTDQLASDGLPQVCSTKDYTKSSLLPFASITTKVNKQYITTNSTNTTKPAINIKSSPTLTSPLKEKAEKSFGGQYTATTLSSSLTKKSSLTKIQTKEAIAVHQQQQQQSELLTNKECKEKIPEEKIKMIEENEEEQIEMCRKVKEVLNADAQATTTSTAIITNKQQMATRLTGSAYNITTNTSATSPSSSLSSSSSSILKRGETEREKSSNITQQHHNITGANMNFVNQSLIKYESERLVCAANVANAGSSNNLNTNNSVTIGGISVSGNLSNNQNTNIVKISQKLQENQFIKNEQHLNTKKIIKFKQNTTSANNTSTDLKSPTKISKALTTSNSTSCLTSSSLLSSHSTAATSAINCAIKKKMVAVQEMKKSTQNSATHLHPITSTCHAATNHTNNRDGVGGGGDTDLDNSEDLSYGPGIVSKLRCRYLSLALRESMEQQRLNKDFLRRSTSLNNLLDNTEDEENGDEDEEVEEDVENQDFHYDKVVRKDPQNAASNNIECSKKAGILKTSVNNGQEKRFIQNSHGSNGVGVTFTETSYNKRSRHLKRGNDSLKRARSVEALLSEKSPWHTRTHSSAASCVTIEDKIHNARERLQQGTDHMPPKRLTSIIDDTERPPPDLVKQTLKMFEATANRRPRATNRSNSKGDVASKVETFKNIIKEQKPAVTFPKPLSPTKKLNNTPIMQKPLKISTPHANDLLQSPLGRKTMAAASSVSNTNDCLTPLKSNNTLSDQTPDIIPRQKFSSERDFKQNKEVFSSKERDVESSPLQNFKRELTKEKYEVDSPLTALSKEMAKVKLSDTPIRKNDNFSVACSGGSGSGSGDNHESENNIGSVGGVSGGDNNGGDAFQHHNRYPYNNTNSNDFTNEETTQKELNTSSLKNENDKIINKTKPNINNEATSSSPSSTTIETKNEAAVNNYDSSTKASSPPPSSSDLSDIGENYDDDEYGGLKTTKRITRTALDNIAKAGYTQQFKFNTTTNNTNSSSTSTTATSSTLSALNTGKQIGVIRPLLNTTQQQQKTPDNNMEALKHSTTSPLTSQEIEKNRINDLKKSSTTTSTNVAATSSNSASLDHQVIKPSHTSSPNTASAANSATGFSDVDTVISATNSPLWAMRKRRQAPPTAPAENTSMVFNFSNRKEVPDYIENDGVIFRRKRELPKPNESGFVLLGDLSVETSTDMDYDDFSMCPPSPCDVEFVNANIVIDGKSSIRQKSKDITFRVQFNDTLTSTFEYPSEASLIVDESFSAYNESYTQPLDASSPSDDFIHAFKNLNLENATHHHVADEIIQLPTLNVSSPAAATNATSSPTKSILGNLPLDYPDLQKGIQLTTATTAQTPSPTSVLMAPEDNAMHQQQLTSKDEKKSRKDLTLPLGIQRPLQKPPLPIKRLQMTKNPAVAGVLPKPLISKDLSRSLETFAAAKQHNKQANCQDGERQQQKQQINGNTKMAADTRLQRKTPRVLNNPQYACFLQDTESQNAKPLQRSRSNEFQKTFTALAVTATVSRSNSLRNLKNAPARSQFLQSTQSTTGAPSLCFSPEVKSNEKCIHLIKSEKAKDPLASEIPPTTPPTNPKQTLEPKAFTETNYLSEKPTFRTQSLNDLLMNSSQKSSNSNETLTRSDDNLSFKKCSLRLTTERRDDNSDEAIKIISNVSQTSVNKNIAKTPTTTASTEHLKELISLPEEKSQNQNSLAAVQSTDSSLISKTLVSDDRQNLNTSRLFENPSTKIPQNLCESTNTFSDEFLVNNSLNSNKSLKSFPITPANKISLTINPKYITDYRSKITKNLPSREIKSMENLALQSSGSNSLRFTVKECSLSEYSIKTIRNSSKSSLSFSHENLADRAAAKLAVRATTSVSNEHLADIIEYSLHRNIKSLEADGCHGQETVDSKVSNLSKSFGAIPESTEIVLTQENSQEFLRSVDKIDSAVKISSNETELVANKQDLPDIKAKVKSQNSALDLEDHSKNSLKPLPDNRNANDIHIKSKLKAKSTDNLTDHSGKYDFNAAEDSKGSIESNDDFITLNKSRQMSTDSLDNYEDAKECSKKRSLTDLEASEILEDISVGFNNSLLCDFNKVLPLAKSKTSYCLQSLEKSNSLESENSLQSDEYNFASACNTLESKCSLNPQEMPLPSEPKSSERPTKTSKALGGQTSKRILNFTYSASQNVSAYATFRKSKNFYKNASKSFKNSLRFYETFNENKKTTTDSSIKRSVSLIESPVKKAELNRKIFSKSNKIITKLKNSEEWDSPTENSYSFEYFDAENGIKVNNNNNKDDAIKVTAAGSKIQQEDHNLSSLQNSEAASADLSQESLVSEKSINLKAATKEFYFNTSPRPFKRLYEATTLVDIEETLNNSIQSDDIKQKGPGNILRKNTIWAENSLTQDSQTLQCFPTPNEGEVEESIGINKHFELAEEKLNSPSSTPSTNVPLLVNSSNISNVAIPTILRGNSFSAFNHKSVFNSSFKTTASFNTYSKNVSRKVAAFNKNAATQDQQNNFSRKSINSYTKVPDNNLQIKFPPSVVRTTYNCSPKEKSSTVGKSDVKTETFKRLSDSSEFSFDLTKCSKNSLKYLDNCPAAKSLSSVSKNAPSKGGDTIKENNFTNITVHSTPCVENFNAKSASNNPLKSSKVDTLDNNLKVKITTPTTPTTTFTIKGFYKTIATLSTNTTTTASTTTPSLITTTTTTTNINNNNEISTEVVADKNSKSSNISYINSSFSSLRTANTTTAKYHSNEKSTIIATKTTTFTSAPVIKNITSINPPKVSPRRLFLNTSKPTTTTAIISTKATSTAFNTTSCTTSSNFFKASSSTIYTSANNNVPPLRRRIPGNTLYYV